MPKLLPCCVLGCKNYQGSSSSSSKSKGVSFFPIPGVLTDQGDQQRRAKWINNIKWKTSHLERIVNGLDRKPSWEPTKHARVCSAHFITGKPSLLHNKEHPDWAPTQNMGYTRSLLPKTILQRYQPSKRRTSSIAKGKNKPESDLNLTKRSKTKKGKSTPESDLNLTKRSKTKKGKSGKKGHDAHDHKEHPYAASPSACRPEGLHLAATMKYSTSAELGDQNRDRNSKDRPCLLSLFASWSMDVHDPASSTSTSRELGDQNKDSNLKDDPCALSPLTCGSKDPVLGAATRTSTTTTEPGDCQCQDKSDEDDTKDLTCWIGDVLQIQEKTHPSGFLPGKEMQMQIQEEAHPPGLLPGKEMQTQTHLTMADIGVMEKQVRLLKQGNQRLCKQLFSSIRK